MANSIKPEKLADAILSELDRYSTEKGAQIAKIIDELADEAKNTLRRTSPKRTGKYQKGWRVQTITDKNGRHVQAVHNKTDYQLTHLLEHGHRNAKGGGSTPARVHIQPVEENVQKELVKKIEEVLNK